MHSGIIAPGAAPESGSRANDSDAHVRSRWILPRGHLAGRPLAGLLSRGPLACGLLAGLLVSGFAGPAGAHLSMIRQGNESAGTREAGDRFGAAVAAGDFNGDGYDDVVVGAPKEALGSSANAGSVTVNWGTAFGTTHEGAEFITAQTLGESISAEAQFGFALAAADFNHDGYDDLVIGAPGDRVGFTLNAGRIFVLRGSASGLNLAFTSNQSEVGETPESGDRFGASLAVGNWNGDTVPYMDLAVGSPGEDGNAGMISTYHGSIFVLSGVASFRSSSFGAANTAWNQFGLSLAGGNLLGTSAGDLAVGCPGRTVTGNNFAGSVFVIRGSTTGLVIPGYTILDSSYQDFVQVGGGFGAAVAVGRFYGGSFDALAVGEPFRNVGSNSATGRVVVIEGGASGFGSSFRLQQTACGGTEATDDQFGSTLAAGFFEAGGIYEDLAVGCPGEGGSSAAPNSGAVHILYGGTSGPNGSHGWAAFDQSALNEWRQADDQLGYSLAFGNFDDSRRGALLVGAPGNDSDTGIVHLIAPWRQTYGLQCQYSVVTDCEGNLIFTQKPFDQVWIASTTKTMTVLLAAERSQLPVGDPDRVDLDWEYEVPEWCFWEIPGSQVPLAQNERMTLRELMWTCLFMSGNDAAFAIADLCEGSNGPDSSVPAYVAKMNARAVSLGMNGTHFHNPAGLDNEPVGPELGEHYSTPHEMMLLSRAAMDNEIVSEIVGSSSFTMTRRFASGYNEQEWEFLNIFRGVLANNIEPMNGIKGGSTPRAQATGLFSAGIPGKGDALVTTFLTPNVDGNHYTADAAHLMQLGTAECDYDLAFSGETFAPVYLSEMSTCEDSIEGRTLELDFGPPGDLLFDAFLTQGQNLLARFEMNHTAEYYFDRNQSVELGIGPFQERGVISIRNMGTVSAQILFAHSVGGTPVPYTIPVGGVVSVPAFSSPTELSQYLATVTDIGGARPTHLSVEVTYGFEVDVQGVRGGDLPAFSVSTVRDPLLVSDGMQIRVVGQDPNPGAKVLFVAHEPGGVVDVAPVDVEDVSDGPALTNLQAGPNPFVRETTLRFTLRSPASVDAQIFDASGRLVRSVGEHSLAAGTWSLTWNGRDGAGATSPAGVYFYRISVDGVEAGTGKLVRVE